MSNETNELFAKGYCRCRLASSDCELLAQTLKTASEYFDNDEETKSREYFPGKHLGYRLSGIEYSATPDRPDLDDSLNISTGWRQTVPDDSPAKNFYLIAERLHVTLDDLAQRILTDIAGRYPGCGPAPETRDHSWLQVNHYRAFQNTRDILQDKHDDGHLLTIWHSRTPGLEVFPDPDGEPLPITADSDHVFVMPGNLLTMLTGGDIPPLYHRVVRALSAEGRLSLMYFVNPTTREPLFPYKAGDDVPMKDIAAIGASNPLNFGLPALEQSEDA